MSGQAAAPKPERRRAERIAVGLVALLWAFHAASTHFWLEANQFAEGWDRPKHLVSSLIFDDILRPVSVTTLFQVFTANLGYYPPLFPLSMVPLYRLFGVSADVAGMVNAIYMGVFLLSLYGIGRRLYDLRVGLLSAFLGSMFPFLFSMAHYTYIDYALTALITLAAYLLLGTDGFRRAGFSILFGLAVGLGMLLKWTPVVFLAGPFLLIALRGGVAADALNGLRHWRWPWRQALVSVPVALALTWAWYAPNADLAATLLLGSWLPLASVILIGLAVFFILMPARPITNLLKSLSVAALLTSLWYLPRADMFRDLYTIVLGGRADRPNFLSPLAYVYYPQRLISEGVGWPLFILLVLLAALALCRLWRKRIRPPWQDSFVVLWFVIPFIVATLSTHREVRSVLPLLAPVAVAAARLLLGIRHRTVRRAGVTAVVLFLCLQFAVLSVTPLAGWAEASQVELPVVGRVGLFAQGEHILWPNSGQHDSRYWVIPDVLQTITSLSSRAPVGTENGPVRLGLLINSRRINEYNTEYVIRTGFPGVAMENLTTNRDLLPGYARLFGSDYLLMRDSPDSSEPAEMIRTLLSAPPDFFSQGFALVKTYPWPDGEKVHLFQRRDDRIPKQFGAKWLAPIEYVTETNFGDRLRLLGYTVDESRVPTDGKLLVTLYWMGLAPTDDDYSMDLKLLNGVQHVWGEQTGRPRWDAGLTSQWATGQVVEDIRELPVWPGTPPGSYQIEVLATGLREGKALEPAGGRVLLGPVKIPDRRPPNVETLDMGTSVEATLDNRIRLLGYTLESGLRPGDGMHLTLFWQALADVGQDYVVFQHLVGQDGRVWGQKDNPPVDGYYPTSRWQAGEIVRDRYDLLIPPGAPPQEYTLETGMYSAATGQRLPVTDTAGQPGADTVILKRFGITGE